MITFLGSNRSSGSDWIRTRTWKRWKKGVREYVNIWVLLVIKEKKIDPDM